MIGAVSGTPPRPQPPVTDRFAAPPRRLLAPSRARQAPSAGAMARRRFLLRWTKRLLPLAATLLLAAIALWPEIDRMEERGRVSFRRVMQAAPDAVRVVQPRYQGVDEVNRPYTVTALLASQAGSPDVFDLDHPRADIVLSGGAWVMVESRSGRYDRANNHLDLWGEVTIWHDNGTLLVTEEAAVEVAAGTASGDRPVAAQGPFGTLTSDGFRLTERGQVVVFTGNAHAVLEGGQ